MSSILSSRERSAPRCNSSSNNHKFVTKWKTRNGNKTVLDSANETDYNATRQGNVPDRKSRSFIFPNSCTAQEDFDKTFQDLKGSNFKHHNPELCVCKECLCGRHYCKMHNVKPDLTKNSIYKVDFNKKKPIDNKVNISKEYDRLNGPHLDMNSIYLKDFHDIDTGKVQRPIPEDLLKTGGPCSKLSSYSSGFPGYKGGNQYVKPTDQHTRANFPLRANSTYTKSFMGDQGKKDPHERIPDNLKTGKNWFGDSHYSDKFRHPNPEDYPAHNRIKDKKQDNPDYSRQYETIYKNSFLGSQNTVCPAKIIIETKDKGIFTNSKSNFTENSDFKAMSPQFHAISTSKHCYV